MSRLIRDPDLAQGASVPEKAVDDVTALRLLKALQALAVEEARAGFRHFLAQLDSALHEQAVQARSNQAAQYLVDLQKQFKQKCDDLERYFCGYLAEGFVKFRKQQLFTTTAQDAGNTSELALVDHDKLEEMIAISSIAQRADVYYAEPLWALNRRLSVLNRGNRVVEESNPAAPIQLCESWRRALKLVPINAWGRAAVYRVYDEHMFSCAGRIVQATNGYLKTHGVLTHLHYSQPSGSVPNSYLNATGDGAEHCATSIAPPGNQMMQAIRDLQSKLASADKAAPSPAPAINPSIQISIEHVVEALTSLQGQAAQLNTAEGEPVLAPADIQAVVRVLSERLNPEEESSAGGEMQTIDLVGMVFEYMLNDENLPDAVKALLSYLHTPFLKLAFVDPGFFEQPQHPARVLLNNLAEAGARWVNNDGSSQFGIYDKIKETVERVLRDFDNDVRVIAELLFEFSSYAKQISRRQELMEKRATEKAQGEERLREVKQRANSEIRRRINSRELPSAVLLLLLQPWADFLSFTLLRHGEQSDNWHEGLALVDDVLWSIEPKDTDDERQRQRELSASILRELDAGFETIGYDQSKAHKLRESIAELIDQVMQSQSLEPAPAPVRSEMERLAAEKAGSLPDDHEEALTQEEAQMVENLKMIEFGTWLEFDGDKGIEQRLKVAWYNQRTSHYMLVDQMGKKAAMMSGLEMARALIAGKARVISGSSKPFFDRALENIYQKLNAQAEAAQAKAMQPEKP